MTPLQHLRLQLGLPADRTAEEIARDEALHARLRNASPPEQMALRLNRLRAAGWDALAHGNDPRRLAGAVPAAPGALADTLVAARPAPIVSSIRPFERRRSGRTP